MIRLAFFCTMLLLTACAQTQQLSDEAARKAARAAVDEVLVIQFPGIDGTLVTPLTDCVIDGASSREIASLARAALVGVDGSTLTLVTDITQRPEVTACLLRAGFRTF